MTQSPTGSVLEAAADEWVGRSITYDPYPVTAMDIKKYCTAVGIEDPIHLDREAARAAGHPDVVAPAGYHMAIRHTVPNLIALTDLFPDGGGPDLTPPSRSKRRMAGESSMTFHRDIHAGDVLTVTKTIASLEEKVGRGGPLAFVTYDLVYRDAHGHAVLTETYVRILR